MTKSEIPNSGPENGLLNELNRTAPMRLQLSGQLGSQIPHLPYNLNVLSDARFQPQVEMTPQDNTVDYRVNASFEVPRPVYETPQHSWPSTSGPCSVALFDHHLYPQVSLYLLYIFKVFMPHL